MIIFIVIFPFSIEHEQLTQNSSGEEKIQKTLRKDEMEMEMLSQ